MFLGNELTLKSKIHLEHENKYIDYYFYKNIQFLCIYHELKSQKKNKGYKIYLMAIISNYLEFWGFSLKKFN